MRDLPRVQLTLRWLWLLSMSLVSVSISLTSIGWVALGLSWGWAVWLTVAQGPRHRWAPSRPWVSGIDLALGIALILAGGGWRSPFFSVWLLLGVMEGLRLGAPGGMRLASLGLLLSLLSLIAIEPPAPVDLMVFACLVLGVLFGTWLLARAAGRLGREEPSLDRLTEHRPTDVDPLWVLDAAALLGVAVDTNQVVEHALELTQRTGERTAGPCCVALLLAGESGWAVRGARRLMTADRQVAITEPIGLLAKAAETRRAVISRQPADDPGLAALRALRESREVACVALTHGGIPSGFLLVGWSVPQAASPASLAELEAIGRLTSAGLEGLHRLEEAEAERQRQGDVQEESRRRLARDLHDGPTQAVASLAMRLNYIGKLVDRDPSSARKELVTAEEMARRATRDIRHMLFALRPLILESQGLVPALWQLGQKVFEVQGEEVIVEAERQDAEGMNPLQQSVTFYIAEEAINNAVKHAQARHIWVRLKPRATGWRLEVEDDGVGFNVGAVDEDYAQRGSLGLVNMRERAALAGGQVEIHSQEGSGTRIEVSIPRRGAVNSGG